MRIMNDTLRKRRPKSLRENLLDRIDLRLPVTRVFARRNSYNGVESYQSI
jgi:hypothetical protein